MCQLQLQCTVRMRSGPYLPAFLGGISKSEPNGMGINICDFQNDPPQRLPE